MIRESIKSIGAVSGDVLFPAPETGLGRNLLGVIISSPLTHELIEMVPLDKKLPKRSLEVKFCSVIGITTDTSAIDRPIIARAMTVKADAKLFCGIDLVHFLERSSEFPRSLSSAPIVEPRGIT